MLGVGGAFGIVAGCCCRVDGQNRSDTQERACSYLLHVLELVDEVAEANVFELTVGNEV